MKVLITGIAGFIGFHLARRLAERGDQVLGVDNLNEYYDVSLKHDRLGELGLNAGASAASARGATDARSCRASRRYPNLRFRRLDLADAGTVADLVASEQPEIICHLAAQAGVRYSLEAPFEYVTANLQGFLSVLEAARRTPPRHLVYASTSSVFGLNGRLPFSPHHSAEHPVSLYAATKKANEMMAHSYGHVFDLPTTGLRFFTVYGPWGRPDMAPVKFARKIAAGEPIDVYNYGDMRRDFTYVDDIVEGILLVLDNPPERNPDWDRTEADPASSSAPYRIFNIGNGSPVELRDFISALEQELGREAEKNFKPMYAGDMAETWADTSDLEALGYQARTPVDEGVARFVEWFRSYYGT
ncbi:MAG: NAD-dependent epimerase [Spirochaetota bacterium]